MSTRIRVQGKEIYQHITTRGNNKQALFRADEDYQEYRSLLIKAQREYVFEVPSHSLMTNHVHQMGRFEFENMPEAVQYVHGRYARWFNRKYERVGHLFQRRYDARVIADERYLHEVGRYIHMNPVSAGLCDAPEDYPWSSFREYWTGSALTVPAKSPLTGCFTVGGKFDREAFRKMTMAKSAEFEDPSWYVPDVYAPPRKQPQYGCDDPRAVAIVRETAKAFGMLPGDLKPQDDSRLTGAVRGLALLLLRESLPWNLRRIGAVVGMTTPSGVARAIHNTRRRMEIDREFRTSAELVKKALGGV